MLFINKYFYLSEYYFASTNIHMIPLFLYLQANLERKPILRLGDPDLYGSLPSLSTSL